jgi:hypothetical protein
MTTRTHRYTRPDNLTEPLEDLVPRPPQCPECFQWLVARWPLQTLPPRPQVSCPHRRGQT